MQRTFGPAIGSGGAPMLVRLGGKLVLEVLPAALASAIGAFLFAQYQFDRGTAAAHAVSPAVAVPASAEMLQLVREEHAMIRDFLTAQQEAAQNRAAVVDAADTQAPGGEPTADATLAAAVPQQSEPLGAAKPPAPHNRTLGRAVVAARGPESAAALPPIVIAGVRPAAATVPVLVANAQPSAGLWPPAPPSVHPSIVAETLAVPGHVVSVTLHAVMAIGGIPSWFGHRFGDDDVSAVPVSSAS
ncbi:MAG TPA: hypothetical protein VIJ04_11420 [Xanthobacteraceae bacterium]